MSVLRILIFNSLFWKESFPLIKNMYVVAKKEKKIRFLIFFPFFDSFEQMFPIMLKNAPNQADNISIFQSCLLPKMRLSVVLEGRFIGYYYLIFNFRPKAVIAAVSLWPSTMLVSTIILGFVLSILQQWAPSVKKQYFCMSIF